MSELVLGWKMTAGLEPEYWLNNTAKPGEQLLEDLVTVPSEKIGTHTVIIGQSGSGKSFFLGRFIEEILLNTRAKCIIMDTNSDFRRIHEIPPDLWSNAKYDPVRRQGKLPHEKSIEEFKSLWNRISKKTYINHYDDFSNSFFIWWPNSSSDILFTENDTALQSQLNCMHNFVSAIGKLEVLKSIEQNRDFLDPLEVSQNHLTTWNRITTSDKEGAFANYLKNEYALPKLLQNVEQINLKPHIKNLEELGIWFVNEMIGSDQKKLQFYLNVLVLSWLQKASNSLKYVSNSASGLYFNKAQEFVWAGIL